MKSFIGDGRALDGNILIVNVLGNYLPEENEGYKPCLEVHFDNEDDAWNWYCKGFKIIVRDKYLKDSKHKGFKLIDYNNCTFIEMTKEEIQNEVRNYREIYG